MKQRIDIHAALATTASCVLLASCSTGNGSPGDSDHTQKMQETLCDTRVSTNSLREMYPGPYLGVEMSSDDGGIKGVDVARAAAHGECNISIMQKKGKIYSVISIHVRVKPQKTANALFRFYKEIYPNHLKKRLDLGRARGFTTPEKSVLVFDCRQAQRNDPQEGDAGVSVQALMPSHRGPFSINRGKAAELAAKLVADTARYVNSEVLKCSGPGLPDGAPRQEPSSAP